MSNIIKKDVKRIINRADTRKVPIVGAPNSGKTWFLCALNLFLSKKDGAHLILNDDGYDYLTDITAKFQQGEDIEQTKVGKKHVEIYIDAEKMGFKKRQLAKAGLILSSGDISGNSFVERDEYFKKFIEKTEMLIVLLDLAEISEGIIGRRMLEVARAIEDALKFNNLHNILFIVTKNDGLIITLETVIARLKQVFPLVMARLTFLKIHYDILTCSSKGNAESGGGNLLDPQGFDKIVQKLIDVFLVKN